MLPSLRGLLTPREGVGSLPAHLLDRGQLPLQLTWPAWWSIRPRSTGCASIRTAGLTKDFGDLRAVNEIDLDLPEGGVAGFVGPNGAGKSTTIRMLLGLITPTGGEGEVFGPVKG